jgi:hypothetical protein
MKAKITPIPAIILLALCALASGEQRVSGVIDRDARWKAEEGPFIVEGDILITKKGNLVIFPGARIIIKSDAKKGGLAAPFDKADSALVSIRVQGAMNCIGRRNNPIVFEPEKSELADFSWRGIILEDVDSRYTEIAFTEITGASTAVTVRKSGNVMVRNSAFENCNIGVHVTGAGNQRVYNNLITSCFTAAIKAEDSNPQIMNNIIVFNNNLGLWCDNASKITFRYNCVFGNTFGNFLDCDPELGKVTRGSKNRDSTDVNGNIITDPIFAGSAAEAKAVEIDISLQTDSSKVKDKKLLHLPNLQFGRTIFVDPTLIGAEGRELSKYSPCINAGNPGGPFKNVDGSRNTMGPSGGPDNWNR